ncbi:MAG: hypothetical protein ACREHD_29455 [Pirellulales bacterium]
MKSLLTALGALALGLVLTSIAAAQELQPPSGPADTAANTLLPYLPNGPADTAAAATSESPPLSVAEAKKRYLEKQKSLEELAKGGALQSTEVPVRLHAKMVIDVQEPRDRLRTAVAEAFDARRQLQQAELAELEARIARIKRALEIRDAMRETLIDQRTDELLEQMDEEGKSGQPDAASAPGAAHAANPGAKTGGATRPALDGADALHRVWQGLKTDLAEAKADLESAGRARDRALRLYQSGAISEEAFDEEDQQWKLAKLQLDRLVVKADAFQELHRSDLPELEPDLKEAEVEVLEAEENLSGAKRLYEYSQKMHTKGYVTEADVDTKAAKYKRAKLELERAKAKLEALGGAGAGDRAVDAPDQALIDDSQIVWGPKDTDRIPASAGEPIASIQMGHLIEPKKVAYAPGDVLTVKLFLKYTGKQAGTFKAPRSEILEKLGIDLVLHDAAGDKLNWGWAQAHKQPARPGHVLAHLAPGEIHSFPPMKILVGPAELVGKSGEPEVFAYLDVKPGQTAQLSFKLTGDPDMGGVMTLKSGPVQFRVEEPAKKPATADGSVTDRAPSVRDSSY